MSGKFEFKRVFYILFGGSSAFNSTAESPSFVKLDLCLYLAMARKFEFEKKTADKYLDTLLQNLKISYFDTWITKKPTLINVRLFADPDWYGLSFYIMQNLLFCTQ